MQVLMQAYHMIVPNFECETRRLFAQWIDTLEHSGICAQVYRNSSEETATILEKAHGKEGVFLVRVEHTGTYLLGAEERARNLMEDIHRKIQLNPERHLVLIETHDDFRYEP